MSTSGITSSSISTVSQDAPHERLQAFLKRVQSDQSPEAQQVKDAFAKLQSDTKAGSTDEKTLQADRHAMRQAMQAYRKSKQGSDGDEIAKAGRPKGHHHHHGAGKAGGTSQPASTAATVATAATSATSATGGIDLTALLSSPKDNSSRLSTLLGSNEPGQLFNMQA